MPRIDNQPLIDRILADEAIARRRLPPRKTGLFDDIAPLPDETILPSDVAKQVGAGIADIGTAAGSIARLATDDAIGGDLTRFSRGVAGRLTESLSPGAKNRLAKRFLSDQPGELFGEGATDLGTIGLHVARSLPSIAPGAGVGALAARGAGRFAAQRALSRGATEKAAQAAATKAGRTAAVTAGGATEGGIAGGLTADQVEQEALKTPAEVLKTSPFYQQQINAGKSEAEARRLTARAAAESAFLPTAAATAVIGAPFNAYLGRLFGAGGRPGLLGRGQEAVKGAATEAPVEALQSGGEEYQAQRALRDIAGGPEIDPREIAEASAAGFFAGGALGGGVGAIGGGGPGEVQPDVDVREDTELLQLPPPARALEAPNPALAAPGAGPNQQSNIFGIGDPNDIITLPDGSGLRRYEVEEELNSLVGLESPAAVTRALMLRDSLVRHGLNAPRARPALESPPSDLIVFPDGRTMTPAQADQLIRELDARGLFQKGKIVRDIVEKQRRPAETPLGQETAAPGITVDELQDLEIGGTPALRQAAEEAAEQTGLGALPDKVDLENLRRGSEGVEVSEPLDIEIPPVSSAQQLTPEQAAVLAPDAAQRLLGGTGTALPRPGAVPRETLDVSPGGEAAPGSVRREQAAQRRQASQLINREADRLEEKGLHEAAIRLRSLAIELEESNPNIIKFPTGEQKTRSEAEALMSRLRARGRNDEARRIEEIIKLQDTQLQERVQDAQQIQAASDRNEAGVRREEQPRDTETGGVRVRPGGQGQAPSEPAAAEEIETPKKKAPSEPITGEPLETETTPETPPAEEAQPRVKSEATANETPQAPQPPQEAEKPPETPRQQPVEPDQAEAGGEPGGVATTPAQGERAAVGEGEGRETVTREGDLVGTLFDRLKALEESAGGLGNVPADIKPTPALIPNLSQQGQDYLVPIIAREWPNSAVKERVDELLARAKEASADGQQELLRDAQRLADEFYQDIATSERVRSEFGINDTEESTSDAERIELPSQEAEPETLPGTGEPGRATSVAGETGRSNKRGGVERVDEGAQGERGAGRPEQAGEGNAGGPQAGRRGEPGATDREHPARAENVERPVSEGINYQITAADQLGAGGAKTKARQNIAAIRIIKQIEQEGRSPTDDERKALVKYTGWGASELANGLFPLKGRVKPDWQALHDELKGLLTEDEWKAAASSTQYAHFTSESVIRSIYNAIERFGFEGGLVLEPGMGVGHFLGLMPGAMAAHSQYTGIEFDPVTAQIAKHLYPESAIHHANFIEFQTPDNLFDLTIGNPPFKSGAIRSDPKYRTQGFSLHEYFIAKSVDALRDNGVAVFVVSRYLMDRQGAKFRQWLQRRTSLLGAVRLPQTAFRANAGTDVVTDVLFLQKGETDRGQAWGDITTVAAGDGEAQINEYYQQHPDMVLGAHSLAGSMRGANEYTVEPLPNSDIETLFAQATQRLPSQVYSKGQDAEALNQARRETELDKTQRKRGAYFLSDDGRLMQSAGGGVSSIVSLRKTGQKGIPKKHADLIKTLVPIKEKTLQLLDQQLNDDPAWEQTQADLNRLYDAFVDKHGPINKAEIRTRKTQRGESEYEFTPNLVKAWRADPDAPIVTALDDYDIGTGKSRKGSILTGRVVEPDRPPKIETPQDALASVLNETGQVDIDRMAELLKIPHDEVIESLGDNVYFDPLNQEWQTDDEYLSGSVRRKLREAEVAARKNPALARNAEALRAAQPNDIPPSKIGVRIGSSWVDAADYENFIKEIIGAEASISHVPEVSAWSLNVTRITDPGVSAKFRTPRKSVNKLLAAALNQQQVSVYDTIREAGSTRRVLNAEQTELARQKVHDIKEAFTNWIFKDGERAERLAKVYNEKFNDIVPRKFNGSHLRLPGLASNIKLRPHQLRVVWRIMSTGNTYMAHTVGSGKTMASIAAGMEQKRLGLIKKPMYVVPNHMLRQFSKEFLELYPAAKLLIADEEAFHTKARHDFVARAATEPWDAVIMTHSSFGLIDAPKAMEQQLIDEELERFEQALLNIDEDDAFTRKRLEARITSQRDRLQTLANKTADPGLSFESLGADMLFVDEAQEFRKLSFATAQGNIKGIDPNGSQRAWDLHVKSRYLDSLRPNRSLVLMSGTPVTNTLGEMYTIQRFLQPKELERKGLDLFDSWVGQFADTRAITEQTADGNYKIVTRMARFTNIPELLRMFRDVADVVRPHDLAASVELPAVEGGKMKLVTVERTPQMTDYQKQLSDRIEAIEARKGPPRKGDDILLSVITDGRHAALDDRYIDPSLPSDPNTKLNKAIDQVYQTWRETQNLEYNDETGAIEPVKGATQMVFMDLGVSATRGFSGYEWIKQDLITRGVPANEIAFMRDFKKAAAKLKLFADMNAGRVRILIGSSRNMGTGVNAQQRLIALHNVDAPWIPADMEQRHGRIIRQGNKNETVQLLGYATKGTYDSTMFSMNETKQRFIDQMWSDDFSIRDMEDVDGMADQFAQAKALSSGDERLIQKLGLEQDVARLTRLRNAHNDEQISSRNILNWAESVLESSKTQIPKLESLIAQRIETAGDQFKATINGRDFSDRADAGKALVAAVEEVDNGPERHVPTLNLGTVAGFDIEGFIAPRAIDLKGKLGERADFPELALAIPALPSFLLRPGDSHIGLIQKLENQARKIEDRIDHLKSEQLRAGNLKKQSEAIVGQPFDREQELLEKSAELEALNTQMLSDNPEISQEPVDTESLGIEPAAEQPSPFLQSLRAKRRSPNAGGSVLFSRGKRGATGSVPLQQTHEHITRITRNWRGRPPIRVVGSENSLPEPVKAAIKEQNAEGQIRGVHYNGRVYIVNDALTDLADAETVLFHEIMGHEGLRRLFGAELDRALDSLYFKIGGRKGLDEMAARFNVDLTDYWDNTGHLSPKQRRQVLVDELLAHVAQQNIQPTLVQKIVGLLRAGLRKLGLGRLLAFNDADLLRLVGQAKRSIINGQGKRNQSKGMRLHTSVGDQSAADEAVRFSRANDARMGAFANQAGEALKTGGVLSSRHLRSLAASFRPKWLQFLGRQQLVDMYQPLLKNMKRLDRLMRRMGAERNERQAEAQKIVDQWRKLPGRLADDLADIMNRATIAEIYPDKAFGDSGTVQRLTTLLAKRQRTLSGMQQADANRGPLTEKQYAYMEKLATWIARDKRRLADMRKEYKKLSKEYKELPQQAKDVYKNAEHAYNQFREETIAALLSRVKRASGSERTKRQLEKRIRSHFAQQVKGAYFPLFRFGDFVVRGRKPGDERDTVVFAENLAQAEAEADRLRAEGLEVGAPRKRQDFINSQLASGSETFIGQLNDLLKASESDADLIDAVNQLYLQSLPELSLRKHQIHRRKVPGFSKDARRGFARYMFHGAFQLTRLRFADLLRSNIDAMQGKVNKMRGGDEQIKAQQVVDEVNKRHALDMNPQGSPWSQRLTSFGFLQFLGLTPAAAAVNLAQTPIVTLPVLAARVNSFNRASKELLSAYLDIPKMYVGKDKGWIDIFKMARNAEERAALDHAIKNNFIDKTMAHSLAGVAEGQNESLTDAEQLIMRVGSAPFHATELTNRLVTFLAAHRLAKADGKSAIQATEFGREIVDASHFDYTKENRPRIMQGNLQRVIFLFKTYAQNMVYLQARMFHQSFAGETKKARQEARKTFAGIWGMSALFSGTMGLPIFTAVKFVLEAMFDDEDEPYDFDVEFRNFLADHLGQTLGETVAKGVPRGVGFPGDVAERLKLTGMVFRDEQYDLEGKAYYHAIMEDVLGPVFGGFGQDVFEAAELINEGEVQRGMERIVPKAIKDVSKTYRYFDEGLIDRRGNPILEDFTGTELASQLLGFSPVRGAEHFAAKAAIKGKQSQLNRRRQLLTRKLVLARIAGDAEGAAEAMQDIVRFNRRNPDFRITRKTLKQSAKQRLRRQAGAGQTDLNIFIPPKQRRLLEEGRFAR